MSHLLASHKGLEAQGSDPVRVQSMRIDDECRGVTVSFMDLGIPPLDVKNLPRADPSDIQILSLRADPSACAAGRDGRRLAEVRAAVIARRRFLALRSKGVRATEAMLAETMLADLLARAAQVCWRKSPGCAARKHH